jgi:hypothetical protein
VHARVSRSCVLLFAAASLGGCALGADLDDASTTFSTSATSQTTSMTMTTMSTGMETESGSEMSGDGDGDTGDGDPGDGDGEPGDGDGDPTTDGDAVCGDGTKEGSEECDGNDLGGVNCSDFGFQEGTLVCANDCTLFTNACSTCGDGQLAATEECDGNNFGGLTCTDLGFDGGTLDCSQDCSQVIESGCMQAPNCGNGQLDVGEACDGGNLNGQTCESLGYDGGVLACTNGCMINTNGCTVDECVGFFGACNLLFDDCCEGLMCALAYCVPE